MPVIYITQIKKLILQTEGSSHVTDQSADHPHIETRYCQFNSAVRVRCILAYNQMGHTFICVTHKIRLLMHTKIFMIEYN